MRFEWITTKDGSETLFDRRAGESYKSGHAARTETEAVFLNPGVLEHPERTEAERFRILELGFGLGTNLETLYAWWKKDKRQPLEFVTIDSDLSGLRFLGEAGKLSDLTESLLRTGKYAEPGFFVELLDLDFFAAFKKLKMDPRFHTIFFDPFSPKAEPKNWSADLFQKAKGVLRPHGRLVTYSVSRSAKDGLTRAGFTWEKRTLPAILHKRASLLAISLP